jgi:hypothetical protein
MANWPPISPIPPIPPSTFIAWVRHQYPPSCSFQLAWTVQGIRSPSFNFVQMCEVYLNLHLSQALDKVNTRFRDVRFVQCFYNDGLKTYSFPAGSLSLHQNAPEPYVAPQLCPVIRKEANLFPGIITGFTWLSSVSLHYLQGDNYTPAARAIYANYCNTILAGWTAYDLVMLPGIFQQSSFSVWPIQNMYLIEHPRTRYSRRERKLKAFPWPSYPIVT